MMEAKRLTCLQCPGFIIRKPKDGYLHEWDGKMTLF